MDFEEIQEWLQEIGELTWATIVCGARWARYNIDVLLAIGGALLFCGTFWFITSMLAFMCGDGIYE